MTAEDLYGLPSNGGHFELVEGSLHSEPPPGVEHGRVEARIVTLVSSFVRSNGLGTVYSGDPGFLLARAPDTVRGPDLAFVVSDRKEARDRIPGYMPGAPDLAVEIRSPNDRVADVRAKVADYLAAGTRLVWLVDPDTRTVRTYRTLLEPRVLGVADELDGEDVLPGFRVLVEELFAD